jgi:hypothetical protein
LIPRMSFEIEAEPGGTTSALLFVITGIESGSSPQPTLLAHHKKPAQRGGVGLIGS